jgi:uncharacterized protein
MRRPGKEFIVTGYQLTSPAARGRCGLRALVLLPVVLVAILLVSRTAASYGIEYQWWREMNQLPTWLDLMLFGFAPVAVATLLAFAVLFGAHARGMRFAIIRLRENSRYLTIAAAVLLLLAFILSASAIDTWTVVRFFGGRNLPVAATAWKDVVFGLPLKFYLFDLPFYTALRGFVLVLTIAAVAVYWLTARGWQLHGPREVKNWMLLRLHHGSSRQ